MRGTRSPIICFVACVAVFGVAIYLFHLFEVSSHEEVTKKSFRFISEDIGRAITVEEIPIMISQAFQYNQDMTQEQFKAMVAPAEENVFYFTVYYLVDEDREAFENHISQVYNQTLQISDISTTPEGATPSPQRPEYWATYIAGTEYASCYDLLSDPMFADLVHRLLESQETTYSVPRESLLGPFPLFATYYRMFDVDTWGGKAFVVRHALYSSLLNSYLSIEDFIEEGDSRSLVINVIQDGVSHFAYEYGDSRRSGSVVYTERFRLDNKTELDIVGSERIHGLQNVVLFCMIATGFLISVFLACLEYKRCALAKQNKEEVKRSACASLEKSRFVSNMSHEIRTPLNGIIGMTEIIERGALDKDTHYCIGVIRSCGASLLNIVNNILDISAVESGVIDVDMKEFIVRPFLMDLVTDAWTTISTRKSVIIHKLSITFTGNIPEDAIVTDPNRVNQIVTNLLTNAFKYSPKGSISITVDVTSESEKNSNGRHHLTVSVADTGVGISEENQKNLFKAFTRFSPELQVEGTGIGLSISKGIAERLGGDIKCISEVGKGSEFVFKVPVVKTVTNGRCGKREYTDLTNKLFPTRRKTIDKAQNEYKIVPGTKFLVADDIRINRFIIKRLLDRHGCKSDEAANGEETVMMCMKKKYDVILIDNVMPVMDGKQATNKIRETEGLNKKTTIIFVTADVLKESIDSYKKCGGDGFVPKPFREDDLFSVMKDITSLVTTI